MKKRKTERERENWNNLLFSFFLFINSKPKTIKFTINLYYFIITTILKEKKFNDETTIIKLTATTIISIYYSFKTKNNNNIEL
jgi:hypothetical protein